MDANPKYYMEINPLDRIDDLKKRLAGYKVEIKNHEDEGFDWLEDYQDCMIVSNPFSDNAIEILFQEKDEFTFFFGGDHCHFFPYEYDYEEMCKLMDEILDNRVCAAVLMNGMDKWLGSTFIEKEEVLNPYTKTFEFVLKYTEFEDKVKKNGGSVHYTFWNPKDDVHIIIEKQEGSEKNG